MNERMPCGTRDAEPRVAQRSTAQHSTCKRHLHDTHHSAHTGTQCDAQSCRFCSEHRTSSTRQFVAASSPTCACLLLRRFFGVALQPGWLLSGSVQLDELLWQMLHAFWSTPWTHVRFSTDVVFTTPDLFHFIFFVFFLYLFFYLLFSVSDYLFSSCTGLDSGREGTGVLRAGAATSTLVTRWVALVTGVFGWASIALAEVDEVLWSTYAAFSRCVDLDGCRFPVSCQLGSWNSRTGPYLSCRRRRRHEARIPRAGTVLPSFALLFFSAWAYSKLRRGRLEAADGVSSVVSVHHGLESP